MVMLFYYLFPIFLFVYTIAQALFNLSYLPFDIIINIVIEKVLNDTKTQKWL